MKDAFHQLLGRLDTLRHMWRFEALRRVPLLRGLPDKSRAELAAALKQLAVPRGAAVVTQARRAAGPTNWDWCRGKGLGSKATVL